MKRRYLHNLSHFRNTTFDMGELVPVGCVEVLPGDSFNHATSALIRVSPLLAPVMHPVTVRIHHFFVPWRLIWDGYEDFITGGPDGDPSISPPTITVNTGTGYGVGSLADYLGLPTGVDDITHSALPFRAYGDIWNKYYRDQDLGSEVVVSTANGVDTTTNTTLKKCAWEKDYFTSARPWPQKGDAISMPLGESAPLVSTGVPIIMKNLAGTRTANITMNGGSNAMDWSNSNAGAGTEASYGPEGAEVIGLEADLQLATGSTITDLRRHIALQSYAEAAAMYGSEYVDYLRYVFGVTSDDARLRRPEYLGGGSRTISFSEVLQTGPDADDSGVADLRGHGIAALRSNRYVRFFSEHGYVVSLMSVRPKTMYMEGLHRSWTRATKEDYYQPHLENIGMQEVLNKEIYAAHATPNGTFGYQDRYQEYRHIMSSVHGEFRSTLNHWHLAQDYSSDPALNEAFVTCQPTKRILASQSTDALWVMVNHNLRARRRIAPPRPGRIL